MTRAPGEAPGSVSVVTVDLAGMEAAAPVPSSVRQVAERVPQASALEPGQWLACASPPARRSVVARWLRAPVRPAVPLAVRCTALLARGYVDVGASAEGVALGRVPPESRLTPR